MFLGLVARLAETVDGALLSWRWRVFAAVARAHDDVRLDGSQVVVAADAVSFLTIDDAGELRDLAAHAEDWCLY